MQIINHCFRSLRPGVVVSLIMPNLFFGNYLMGILET